MGRIITGAGIHVIRIGLRMFQTSGNSAGLQLFLVDTLSDYRIALSIYFRINICQRNTFQFFPVGMTAIGIRISSHDIDGQ